MKSEVASLKESIKAEKKRFVSVINVIKEFYILSKNQERDCPITIHFLLNSLGTITGEVKDSVLVPSLLGRLCCISRNHAISC